MVVTGPGIRGLQYLRSETGCRRCAVERFCRRPTVRKERASHRGPCRRILRNCGVQCAKEHAQWYKPAIRSDRRSDSKYILLNSVDRSCSADSLGALPLQVCARAQTFTLESMFVCLTLAIHVMFTKRCGLYLSYKSIGILRVLLHTHGHARTSL